MAIEQGPQSGADRSSIVEAFHGFDDFDDIVGDGQGAEVQCLSVTNATFELVLMARGDDLDLIIIRTDED